MRKDRLLILLVSGLFLLACKPKVPKQYIQPDDMEDILYDYYVAQSVNNPQYNEDYRLKYHHGLVFKKYGVTEAEFDSSLVYYYNHIEDLYKIFEKVQSRLSEKALELGATTGEVERYTTHSLSGDTADIWTANRHQILFPEQPYNIYQFTLKADTACHKNDSYTLTFGSSFLVQSGSRNATAYLSVTYDNDSVISQSISVPMMGIANLNIPSCNLRAKEFKGYLYMGRRQGQDNENDMCMYVADHIQLIRFHHPEQSEAEDKTEAPQDTLSDRPVPEKTIAEPSRQRHIEPLTKKQ